MTSELKKISFNDRVTIANVYYGLYSANTHVSENEQVDAECAMDNAGVPYYEHDLTEHMKTTLTFVNSVSTVSNFPTIDSKVMPIRYFKNEFLVKLMALTDTVKVEPPVTYHLDFTNDMFCLSSRDNKNKLEIVNVRLLSNLTGTYIKLSTSDNEKPFYDTKNGENYRVNKLDIYIDIKMPNIEELVFFFLFKLFYPISKNIEVPKSFNGGYLLLNGDNLQEEFFDKLHRFPEIATCSFKQMIQLQITADPL
jgi:hypothetical protein